MSCHIGDTVLTADGSSGTVDAIQFVDEPQVMYNLTVDLVATYLVGEQGWVVHNIDYYVWNQGRPEKDLYGIYRFNDLTHLNTIGEPLRYVGSGLIEDRLSSHKTGTTVDLLHPNYKVPRFDNWIDVEWMALPEDIGSNKFDFHNFIIRAAEKVEMYNYSGGNIRKLANRKWELQNTQSRQLLKDLFGYKSDKNLLPKEWPQILMQCDVRFFGRL